MRAALTFVDCDKSKQKHAFIPIPLYEQDRSGGKFFRLSLLLKSYRCHILQCCLKTPLYFTEKFTLLLVCPTFTAHGQLIRIKLSTSTDRYGLHFTNPRYGLLTVFPFGTDYPTFADRYVYLQLP